MCSGHLWALGEQDAEEKAEKIANPSGYIKARMTAQAIMLRLISTSDVGALRLCLRNQQVNCMQLILFVEPKIKSVSNMTVM